ncbi:MAG: hypothetical protein FWF51_12205 [Chitinivibrionia bacterium]|nr:hypothetical protein [Chitinivibrionia bacterium]
MKLRIIVTLTNSIAIMLPITATAISNSSSDVIFILFLCMGTFLFVASFNFCLINLVDALLLVLGKLKKKNYNITYVRLLLFTILLCITLYITGLYGIDKIIVTIPIFICVILFIVYYLIFYNNLKDEKTEITFEKTGIVCGFSAFVAFNNVLFFFSNFFVREFLVYEFLILLILFIITKINRKTKEAEDNQIKKTSDFFLGFYAGGAVGAIGSIIILAMIILLSFSLYSF